MLSKSLCAISALSFCTQVFAAGPIESYVAPPEQFPPESNYKARIPAPLAAYNAPRGTLVGHFVLKNAKCLITSKPPNKAQDCMFPLPFVYKALGSSIAQTVELAEWGYETMGMISYAPSVKDGAYVWSQVQHAAGTVWLKTTSSAVHPYEEVAYLVKNIAVLCLAPGEQCTPVDAAINAEIKRVTAVVKTCFDDPYTIVDRVHKDGKRYYKLSIQNLSKTEATMLPRIVYMPTRNTDGSHTGMFFSRGC